LMSLHKIHYWLIFGLCRIYLQQVLSLALIHSF
jgi:hypothetical protein